MNFKGSIKFSSVISDKMVQTTIRSFSFSRDLSGNVSKKPVLGCEGSTHTVLVRGLVCLELVMGKERAEQIFRCARIIQKSAYWLRTSVRLSVCPSVGLSACISASTSWRISAKFDMGDFHENVSRKSKFLFLNRALYMKAQVHFTVVEDTK